MEVKESFKERQENELLVLMSIYGSDVEDLRPKGKKWKPLNIKIRLTPLQGSSGNLKTQNNVHLVLHVLCTSRYPELVPKLMLTEPKGLSDALLAQVLRQLEEQAKTLEGEVMIYELCQTIQTFLHAHNRPPRGSFYEEMISSQMQREKEQLKMKEDEEELKRQQVMDEVVKRKEQLKTEHRVRRDTVQRSISESSPTHRTLSTSDASESSFINRTTECMEHQRSEVLYFSNVGRKFQKGACLGHSLKGCVAYSGIDLESGQLVFLTEWNFKYQLLEQRELAVEELVNRIEEENSNLVTLRHKNLISYECVLCLRKKDCLVVYLVQDFVLGTSISGISNFLGWSNEGASFVAKGVLESLIYLHNNGVTHKYLFDTAVYMDNSGNIRVTDFGLIPYLQEIMSGQKQTTGDLPALGALIESLSPTPQADMRDFIERCKSARTLSASDLLDHPFLRPLHNPQEPRKETTNMECEAVERPPSSFGVSLPIVPSEKSRLQTEFEVQAYLGRGAYGDVLKVRNILDNQQYAIKRILLTARSKQIFRKMTREVELLSRLNHENVVRYYNSWIETATGTEDSHIAAISSNEWSVSYTESRKASNRIAARVIQEESDESESSDWINMPNRDSSSDGIEFVDSQGEIMNDDEDEEDQSEKETKEKRSGSRNNEIQYMYIQMEFCEKSTLRTAIDSGLYQEPERLWRLFREICEGLLHIHKQGMIHRDLKPVNIFLDSRDQVKIGDFGLATTNILALQDNVTQLQTSSTPLASVNTGKVGTALYVAPELAGNASKSTYNQKVDLYSLGIILFEMSVPLATGMERVKTIVAIRSPTINLPDFMLNDPKCQQQAQVIKWLLNHDPKLRPTAEELLASDLVPPAKMEANELQEMVKHVLANPQSRIYKDLVARCLTQESDVVCELTYHTDMIAILPLFELVRSKVTNLFTRHGAIEVITPLLTPQVSKNAYSNAVRLMTHSGSVVTLPHDLRLPFIRHIALHGVTFLRRYSIGRVYREKKVFNFHPKQIHECAFDIITPNRGNLLVDAELIFIAFDIVNELPALRQSNISFRLNHTSLLRAILLHCNVPNEKHAEVLSFATEFLEGKISKFQLTSALNSTLASTKQNTILLVELLQVEVAFPYLGGSALKTLIRGRGEAAQLVKGAIKELEVVITIAQSFGVTCPINIATGFCGEENLRSKGGAVVWQMNGDLKAGRQIKITTLAAGGRYDSNLKESQKTASQRGMAVTGREISGAGFSFALDKIVYALRTTGETHDFSSIDVVVCVSGSRPPLQDVTQILRSLWLAKIKAGIAESQNPDEGIEMAKEIGAKHLILVGEGGFLRVRSWIESRFEERYVTRPELIGYMQRMLKTSDCQTSENLSAIVPLQTSLSKMQFSNTALPNFELIFVVPEKLTPNKKRRYESQIEQNVKSTLEKFTKKEKVTIVAVDLSVSILKAFIAAIDPPGVGDFQEHSNGLHNLIERFPKNKRYITEIYDEICGILSDSKNTSIVGLYSISETYYRLLL